MATTISRPTLTDSDGSPGSGDVVDAAWIGANIYDKIDALFTGSVFSVDGNLGVRTDNPASYLHGVVGAAIYGATAAGLSLANDGTNDVDWMLYTTNDDLRFYESAASHGAGSDRIFFKSGGSMGIGVNPSVTLQVFKGSSPAFLMQSTTTGTTSADGCGFSLDSSDNAYIAQYENKHLHFLTNGLTRGRFDANGGFVVGSPTGGTKGAGTINASAVYDDNVLLTDHVFEPEYELMPIREMRAHFERHRHLPTIKGRDDWARDGRFSLGALATMLWETVEVQARYIADLDRRLEALTG